MTYQQPTYTENTEYLDEQGYETLEFYQDDEEFDYPEYDDVPSAY